MEEYVAIVQYHTITGECKDTYERYDLTRQQAKDIAERNGQSILDYHNNCAIVETHQERNMIVTTYMLNHTNYRW